MELQDRILSYMREKAQKPLTDEEIIEGLQLTNEELLSFWPSMEALEEQASVIKNRNDLYGLPERMNLVVGRLSMTGKGFGFIIPDYKEKETDTDVFVPAVQMGGAMNGDRVVARVTPSEMPGRSREGEIIRIVDHANKKIVGTFEKSRSFGFVTPDDTKLNQDIFIPKSGMGDAITGMKVVVEITKWPDRHRGPEGNIIETLGMLGEPGVDVLSVMRKYELTEDFPEDVQQAADEIGQRVKPHEYRGRKNRTDFKIVTIDGDDSKDLDDGIYAERRDDGYFLGVYIADVSWYVRENQPLDREARARGTSVYLVDRVIPMLPKALSNGICSLNEGVDRLAMACEMEIDKTGKVKSYEIMPVVINVHRRLTYNIVNKMLLEHDEDLCRDNSDILPMLEVVAELRNAMLNRRTKRGAINFQIPEIKVKLDAQGHPVALVKRTGSLAESMIEQCMLAANETVAEHMDRKHEPFMYRVHEQPGEEKLSRLNSVLGPFGIFVKPDENGEIKPREIQKIVEDVKGKPEERIVSTMALRSMQQARYSEQSLGHFGLAARYYTHFTSPIRRYPDLIVHRLLRETFKTGDIPAQRKEQLKNLLPEWADHASKRERIAVEAERETTEMKEIEYMAGFVGEVFDGVISGVTSFGIFVELENGVEGLVHVSSMQNDYYAYSEEQCSMIGELSGECFRLGDPIRVELVRANVEDRTIDFIIEGNGVYVPVVKKPKTVKVSAEKSSGAKKSSRKKSSKGKSSVKKKTAKNGKSAKAEKAPKSQEANASAGSRKKADSGEKKTAGRSAKPRKKAAGRHRKKNYTGTAAGVKEGRKSDYKRRGHHKKAGGKSKLRGRRERSRYGEEE